MLVDFLAMDVGKEANSEIEEADSIDDVLEVESDVDEISEAIAQIKEGLEIPSVSYSSEVMVPEASVLNYAELWSYKNNVKIMYEDLEYQSNSEEDEDIDISYNATISIVILQKTKVDNLTLGGGYGSINDMTGVNKNPFITITQKERHDVEKIILYNMMLNRILYDMAVS